MNVYQISGTPFFVGFAHGDYCANFRESGAVKIAPAVAAALAAKWAIRLEVVGATGGLAAR